MKSSPPTPALEAAANRHEPAPRCALQQRLNRLYDDNAPRYDTDRAVSAQIRFYFDLSYRTISRMLGHTTPSSLHVDMPVGTGRFLLYLRDHGWCHRMLGLDLSPGMLGQARQHARDRRAAVHLSMGDAFRLPLAGDSVDVLTSLRLFHLFPHAYWPSLITEMHRVVRPGGFLITELRNVLRGTACTLMVRSFRNRRRTHPHYFVAPHKVAALFRAWRRVEMRGIGMDGLEKTHRVAPLLGRGIERLETVKPFCFLSKTLLVKAYK